MSISISLALAMLFGTVLPDCGRIDDLLSDVQEQFYQGQLESAVRLSNQALTCPDISDEQRVHFHLALSRLHDRIALHTNTRPVKAALQSIEAAAALTDRVSPSARAAINLAHARYYYRAEPARSNYPQARKFSNNALAAFESLADLQGQADVIHLIGLLHYQRQELDEARRLFDRSLELEMRSAAPRPVLLADYERHVAFVDQSLGDWSAAIARFERSLTIRRDNNLTDQAMFAAISLGRALVSSQRASEAPETLQYALRLAEDLDSPLGRAMTGLVLGDMHAQNGELAAAIEAYEMTRTVATTISRSTISARAEAEITRLQNSAELDSGANF